MSSRRSMKGEARGAVAATAGGGQGGKNPFQCVLDKENRPDGESAYSSIVRVSSIGREVSAAARNNDCVRSSSSNSRAARLPHFWVPKKLTHPCFRMHPARQILVVDGFGVRARPISHQRTERRASARGGQGRQQR